MVFDTIGFLEINIKKIIVREIKNMNNLLTM